MEECIFCKIAKNETSCFQLFEDDKVKAFLDINPTKLKPFIELMGEDNFITTMGAGVHAHPKGTKQGAKALVQACEAYKKGIDINEYAKTHKELSEAITFFTKNKKSIEEIEKTETGV